MASKNILSDEVAEHRAQSAELAGGYLASLISKDVEVGELLSLDYDVADILVHDSMRQKVGGLPMGCFLLSTRLAPMTTPAENRSDAADGPVNAEASAMPTPAENGPDAGKEDTALILLRVVGNARLPNHGDTEKYRLSAAQRSIDTEQPWDAENKTDQFTLNQLRHAGVRCSVLGTFRMQKQENQWRLGFGADISNFYSGQGMKVYKPMGKSLWQIVNFTKPAGDPHPLAGKPVEIGRVRYASSEIAVNTERENVPVTLDPTDLLARRTALFGMSRSGKSNTIKTVSAAIFKLRAEYPKKGRVGQLIFDVNGEYCNDNPQDKGCLRNVWRQVKNAAQSDVVTYGMHPHPHDTENRRLVRVNFFGDNPVQWTDRESVASAMDMLLAGKSIIDNSLAGDNANYVKAFISTGMEPPANLSSGGGQTRYRRCVTVYRAILTGAGFKPPEEISEAIIAKLFGPDILTALREAGHKSAADTLGQERIQWESLFSALKSLHKFLHSEAGERFDENYAKKQSKSKSPWSDDMLKGLLWILNHDHGVLRLRELKNQHDAEVESDYAAQIVDDLVDGRLVIVDQSTGAPELIQRAADRIMVELFDRQKEMFVAPAIDENGNFILDESGNIKPPPDIVVYAEEAHNLLPAVATSAELKKVWARVAKEGSKFRIGLIYATQEPKSILSNILKNTDNWFVAHLNNQDEAGELKKYYDFGTFVGQILKVSDTGFVRMRCLSNPYIVPIQVNRFVADTDKTTEEDE